MEKSLRNRIITLKRFAGRLGRDVAGNTLAIVAAAIIPLTALVGSGIDMSRAYMAQARLQIACDAGALAGRRAMTNGVVDDTVRAEALKFFRFNFETGESGATPTFSVASFKPTVADGTNTAVVMSASTTVPTTLMSMFGFSQIPISVTCNAKQDFVNTDIVLVLDTTGSMKNKASSSDTDTKIVALQNAVLALYDELKPVQDELTGYGLRLRYGVVPYASSINVGKLLRGVNTSYVASDAWDYQSRVANYTTVAGYTGTPGSPTTTIQTYSSSISASNCSKYGNNQSFSGSSGLPSTTSSGGPAPTATISYSYAPLDWGGSTNISGGGTKTCRRTRTQVTTTYSPYYKFTNWTYQPSSYDISAFVTGSVTIAKGTGSSENEDPGGTVSVSGPYNLRELATAPGATGITTTTSTWDGCIEERWTDNTLTSSTTSIPANAYDLDIALVPTGDRKTKWKPYWKDVAFLPTSVNYDYGGIDQRPQWACPAEARRMQVWDRASLDGYLKTLNPDGGTYHDNGIIWGAHIISPDGVFAADNPNSYNNMPVSRHMIFMTDGLLDTGYQTLYTTYGVERFDARVTPGGGASNETEQASRHRQRFKLMCTAVKGMGVSIWVVAFASSLDTDLTNCATNASQASTSANAADLNAKFVEIGKNIGALRLTK